MKQIIYFFSLLPLVTAGQKKDDIITLRVGYSSTNVNFKEAFEPSVNFFGRVFNTGKLLLGEGFELGVSKNIVTKMFIEISFSTFSGRDTKLIVNNYKNYYTLKGFKAPVTINYLLRDTTKRLRINVGAGVQYSKNHLQQFETISSNTGQMTNQIADINISELGFVLKPGVQFRIFPNLFASFIVSASVSMNGRYSDSPCFSLKYTLRAKR